MILLSVDVIATLVEHYRTSIIEQYRTYDCKKKIVRTTNE